MEGEGRVKGRLVAAMVSGGGWQWHSELQRERERESGGGSGKMGGKCF